MHAAVPPGAVCPRGGRVLAFERHRVRARCARCGGAHGRCANGHAGVAQTGRDLRGGHARGGAPGHDRRHRCAVAPAAPERRAARGCDASRAVGAARCGATGARRITVHTGPHRAPRVSGAVAKLARPATRTRGLRMRRQHHPHADNESEDDAGAGWQCGDATRRRRTEYAEEADAGRGEGRGGGRGE